MRSVVKADEPAIVQYWHSLEVPAEIEALLDTFRQLNPDLPHLLFDDASAEEFIADRFGEREVAAFRACAIPAMQADYLRYCAVFALGGVYCDVDFRCVAPLRSLLEGAEPGHLFRLPNGAVINGLFAFGAARHPLPRLAIDVATANIERRVPRQVNLVTGPLIFTALVQLREAGSLEALAAEASGNSTLEPLAEPFVEAIGSYDTVRDALEGVRISPVAEAEAWVAEPKAGAAAEEDDGHWVNARSSVFR